MPSFHLLLILFLPYFGKTILELSMNFQPAQLPGWFYHGHLFPSFWLLAHQISILLLRRRFGGAQRRSDPQNGGSRSGQLGDAWLNDQRIFLKLLGYVQT